MIEVMQSDSFYKDEFNINLVINGEIVQIKIEQWRENPTKKLALQILGHIKLRLIAYDGDLFLIQATASLVRAHAGDTYTFLNKTVKTCRFIK